MANNYEELVKSLRMIADHTTDDCDGAAYGCVSTMYEAADAIEELLRAAKKMHTWIFLNTGDEQKAYDECGLSDEMNAALGYGGRLEIKADPCDANIFYRITGINVEETE